MKMICIHYDALKCDPGNCDHVEVHDSIESCDMPRCDLRKINECKCIPYSPFKDEIRCILEI